MSEISIAKLSDLSDEYKEKSIELFIDGFGHLFSFFKDKKIMKEFFLGSMDFSMVYVTLYDNNIAGFIGISNNKKRPVSFDIEKFKHLFGKFLGTIIQKPISTVMEKPVVHGDKDLYIEYLVTDKNYRGKGIATKLIEFVCNELGYDEFYIEVLSKNINAKKIYEHLGFVEFKREYNLSTIIRGLGYPIKLKK